MFLNLQSLDLLGIFQPVPVDVKGMANQKKRSIKHFSIQGEVLVYIKGGHEM